MNMHAFVVPLMPLLNGSTIGDQPDRSQLPRYGPGKKRSCRAVFTHPAAPPWFNVVLPEPSFTISPKGHSLLVRKTRMGRGGGLWWSFTAARLRAMELITILNRCHRFPGFVYQHAHFSADKKSIEVAVRPREGSAAVCSRCHLPAPGYDQLAERRFEFIPLWGFLVFLLYTMRRVNCRRCGIVAVEEVPWGDGKRTLTKAYMLFLAGDCHGKRRRRPFAPCGTRYSTRWNTSSPSGWSTGC